MASRAECTGPTKRKREPSTPTSRRRSKRHYVSESPETGSERISTTPGRESAVNIEELTASVQSLGLVDTPKSSRKGRGVREKLKGRVLFEKELCKLRGTRELPNWTDEELGALTSFLMLYTDGKSRVSHKDWRFWDQAGLFIQQQLKTSHCRSGKIYSQTLYSCAFCSVLNAQCTDSGFGILCV